MSSSNMFPFEKLRGRENFDVWKRHAKSYLVIKHCWKPVEKVLTATATEKELEADERALAELTLMIEPSNFAHIATAKSANAAWKALLAAYEDKGLTRKVELLKQLVQLKLSDCESMPDYVNRMVMTSLKVQSAGLNIDDELTASLMLAGLPDEFRALVLAVENSTTELTVDSVKTLLLQDAKFDVKGEGNALYMKNKSSNHFKKKFYCHSCKQPGHISKYCRNKNRKEKNESAKDKNKKEYNALYASLLANKNSVTDWFIDSGATSHMTKDSNILFNKKIVSNKEIIVANNNKISVKCAGDVKMSVKTKPNGKSINTIVKNVEYVPELCTNLLSVRQMTKNGNKVVFENDICLIYNKNNEILGSACVVDDLYRLNCNSTEMPESQERVLAAMNSELWHRRLGHICHENLCAVKNACDGIDFYETNKTKCETCVKGKQTRSSFKDAGKRAESVLDLIHSDVIGPINIKSFSGARFILTFVDDCSRKVFVVPIEKKSDVLHEFIKFKTLVEKQSGRKIKVLRTDNGTEYVNKEFEQYTNKNGILHQKTCPYTPQQNGVAERMNRTLADRVRCMLIDSGLSEKFWAEAIVTAAYLLNRMPTRNDVRSPEEIWSNKKPNLKHIRIFGCKAMVHVPKEKRSKFAPKSIECILVGYCGHAKGYRLLNPQTNKIIVSRDVIFFEAEDKVNEIKEPKLNLQSFIADFSENDDVESSSTNNSEGEAEEESSIANESAADAMNTPPDEIHDDTFTPARIATVIEGERRRPRILTNNLDELDDTVEFADAMNVPDDVNDETFAPNEDVTVAEGEIRRSERIQNKQRPGYNFCAIEYVSNDPATVKEAFSSPDACHWKAAMKEEYDSLMLNETWTLSKLPAGKKAISSKWVFKTKVNADGVAVRHKARLVAKGFNQLKGIDYNETYAPVVRYTSIRFLLALAAKYDLLIHQMDAVTAFLNAKLQEEIFMTKPIGFDDGSGLVCKLKRSLYGLKQSSRMWNEELNNVLLNFGLERSNVDQCIYYQANSKKMLMLAIYVDDVIIFANDIKTIIDIKAALSAKFKMKDMGQASSILGMRIRRDEKARTIKIDQSQYIAEVLARFGMDQCNGISTPIDLNQKLTADMCPSNDANKMLMKNVPYMQAVGCLLFAAQITRPDICFAVNMLSRFSENPGKAHWNAVKRVMRYLKGTINKGLIYYTGKCSEITGYCDADWASDIDSRRSTTGYVFTHQGAAISWGTRRQRTIALSTTEAEFMAIVAAIQESIWLKRLEKELIVNATYPLILFCDNKSAIHVATNNSYSSRTKHVDIKSKFISEAIKNNQIVLKYIETNNMLADILTKGVVALKQMKFLNEFGLN